MRNQIPNLWLCSQIPNSLNYPSAIIVLGLPNIHFKHHLTLDTSSFPLLSLMNTFSNSGLIPSTLHGTRETVDFGTEMFDSGIGTDLETEAFTANKRYVGFN